MQQDNDPKHRSKSMQQDNDPNPVHNRMASEKQNLPFGVAKSEPRPQPNSDAMDWLEEGHTTEMSKEYDRAKAVLPGRMC